MSRSLNILFMIDELDIGGTEQQILELVRHIDKSRYKPMVCCLRSDGRVADEIRQLGVKVVLLRKRMKFDFFIIPKLMRFIKEERIDIVQTYLITANIWGVLAAKLAGVRWIFASERNVNTSDQGNKHPFADFVFRVLCTLPARIIGNADAVSKYLVEDINIPKAKVVTIHNGINLDRFDCKVDINRKKSELGLDLRSPVIGVIARLSPQKNHRMLLQATLKVVNTIPDLRMLIVGDGPLLGQIKDLCNDLDLASNVIFTGARRDVPEIMQVLDISVLPSLFEGFPNTIMESMAAGKPVIATDVGGNPELVENGKTGYIVPSNDPEVMADAILHLLKNRILLAKLGKAGRRRIEKYFTLDRMVQKTEQMYSVFATLH